MGVWTYIACLLSLLWMHREALGSTFFSMPEQMLWWTRKMHHLVPGPRSKNSPVPTRFYASNVNINDLDHEYMIINDNMCLGDSDIFLVMVIRTVFNQSDRRMAIRKTWGNAELFPSLNIKTVFLLGTLTDADDQIRLLEEHEKYGDIVQQSFRDSYSTLTIKDTMAFKYIYTFCSHAYFAMVGSDEIVVDMFKLVPFLQDYALRTDLHIISREFAVCYLFPCCTRVHRRHEKYSASPEEYDGTAYPQYCSGTAYIASTNVIEKLLFMSTDTAMFMPDDAWIGVLAEKLNLRFRDTFRSFSGISNKPSVLRDFDNRNYENSTKMIAVLDYDFPGREAEMIYRIWNLILKYNGGKLNTSKLWTVKDKIEFPKLTSNIQTVNSLYPTFITLEIVMIAMMVILCFIFRPMITHFCKFSLKFVTGFCYQEKYVREVGDF